MGSSEYLGWHEYLSRDGWSRAKAEERAIKVEILLATLLSMTANINRDAEKNPKPFEIYDFAPWLKPSFAQPVEEAVDMKTAAKEIDAGMIETQERLKAIFPKVNHA